MKGLHFVRQSNARRKTASHDGSTASDAFTAAQPTEGAASSGKKQQRQLSQMKAEFSQMKDTAILIFVSAW